MSPAVGVLVAMALMALLGAGAATCGVVVGAVAFAPAADVETPRTPTTRVSGEAHVLRHKAAERR